MIKPVYYLQGDSKWGSNDYSAKGEKKTIKSSGCGPTSAAMVLETLRPDISGEITPAETAVWSMLHGYKYLNQGTAYAYFAKQFEEYHITCKQLNTTSLYHNSSSKIHTDVKKLLRNDGYFVIACMGVGNWTGGGHYVVAYHIDDANNIYINDPASKGIGRSGYARTKAPFSKFKNEVKYYWSVKWGTNYKVNGEETKKHKLYKSKDVTSKKIEVLNGGNDIWVIRDMKDGWSLVASRNNVGYMRNGAIKALLSSYPKADISKNSVMRDKNSVTGSKITTLSKGTEVQVITKRKNWTYVKLVNGKTGWVKTATIA